MNTTNQKFKVGDKCFYSFKESEILEMTEDGIITHIKENKLFHISGYNLTCFPADIPDIVVFSKFTDELMNNIHELKFNSLNIPDIKKKVEEFWENGCEAILKGDSDKLKRHMDELENFVILLIDRVNALKDERFAGINIFRRS